MSREGLIQFTCHLTEKKIGNTEIISAINDCRTKLFDLGFIGVDANGQGYGNISVRTCDKEFIITASQTGKYRILEPNYFTEIKKCIFKENKVYATGENMPSSESLTHGALYESNDAIQAVIHVHCKKMWDFFMNKKFLSTPIKTGFGTADLALAIISLCENPMMQQQKIFAMGGHESGVIAFGQDLHDAEDILLGTMRLVEN